jgi:hypothetical protein
VPAQRRARPVRVEQLENLINVSSCFRKNEYANVGAAARRNRCAIARHPS